MSGRRPTPEQAKAIAAAGADVLVEAGAGTGKTGVMVDRYCRLVCDEGIAPDSVLAFTFTDKAAAELRQRIRAAIELRADAGSDRARELLDGLGSAWVMTIHGFCNRLLASHPVAVGIDPRFRVLDAAEADRVADEAFEDALEEFLAAGDPEREQTVAGYDVAGLRGIVIAVHAELRSRGLAKPVLPDAPESDVAGAIRRALAAAEAALPDLKPESEHHATVARAIEALSGSAEPPSLDLMTTLQTGKKGGQALAGYREAIDAAVAAVAEAGEGGVVYDHLGTLLGIFTKRFAAAKERRAGLDFEDLQILATRLLVETDLGAEYSARFTHLLIDEFQDTNRSQLRLIEALRGPATEVMMVGDELQSIYGFRHADLDVFREQRRRVEEEPGSLAIDLSGNFRSRPEVIGAVNEIGGHLLGSEYRPLRVGALPDPPAPPGDGTRGRAADDRREGLGRAGNRPAAGDRRPDPAEPARRGPLRRLAASRARRRRRPPRRDGRPPARLHPPRRLRGLARARRAPALRRRRPRLLVPAAGRRRLRPAGRDRQPARRHGAVRGPGLTRRRRQPRHALAAARRRRAAAPGLAGDRAPCREPARSSWTTPRSSIESTAPTASCSAPSRRPGASSARGRRCCRWRS